MEQTEIKTYNYKKCHTANPDSYGGFYKCGTCGEMVYGENGEEKYKEWFFKTKHETNS